MKGLCLERFRAHSAVPGPRHTQIIFNLTCECILSSFSVFISLSGQGPRSMDLHDRSCWQMAERPGDWRPTKSGILVPSPAGWNGELWTTPDVHGTLTEPNWHHVGNPHLCKCTNVLRQAVLDLFRDTDLNLLRTGTARMNHNKNHPRLVLQRTNPMQNRTKA